MRQLYLNGLFIRTTPRDLIEGYTDHNIVGNVNHKEIFEGGDPAKPAHWEMTPFHENVNVSYFYGGISEKEGQNYLLTNNYGSW